MAITSEIIGKLGGAGVDMMDLSATNISGINTTHFLTHIDVPEGKQYLVSLIASFSRTISGNRAPKFQIGDAVDVTSGSTGDHASMSAIITAPSDIKILTDSSGNVTFSGKLYTVEM